MGLRSFVDSSGRSADSFSPSERPAGTNVNPSPSGRIDGGNVLDANSLSPAPIRCRFRNAWGEDARGAIHSEVRAKGLLVQL